MGEDLCASGEAWQLRVFAGRDPVTGHKRWIAKTVHGDKRRPHPKESLGYWRWSRRTIRSSKRVVPVPVAARTGHVIQRRDGTTVPLETDLARFSTPELLAIERRLLDESRLRTHEDVAHVRTLHVRLAVSGQTRLSVEQSALVFATTQSGRGVDVVVGAAGTGRRRPSRRRAWRTASTSSATMPTRSKPTAFQSPTPDELATLRAAVHRSAAQELASRTAGPRLGR